MTPDLSARSKTPYYPTQFRASDFDEAYNFSVWNGRIDFGHVLYAAFAANLINPSVAGEVTDMLIVHASLMSQLNGDPLCDFRPNRRHAELKRGHQGTVKIQDRSLFVITDALEGSRTKFVPLNGFWIGDGYRMLELKAAMLNKGVLDLCKDGL